jgi:hypothetical protein
MSDHEAFRNAVETIASNPKVAAPVGVTTAAMGFAEAISAANSILATVALVVGIVSSILVIRVTYINLKLKQRQLDKLKAEKP